MAERETILIIDFGAQYNQLIARRVREASVYSEVVPYDVSIERIKEINPKGIDRLELPHRASSFSVSFTNSFCRLSGATSSRSFRRAASGLPCTYATLKPPSSSTSSTSIPAQ